MQNLKRTNRWGPCIPNHLCHIHVYVARVHVGTLEAGNPAKRVQMPKETCSRLCVCVFRCCFHLKSSDSSRERSEARLWLQASAPGRAEHRWIQSCVKVEVAVLGSPSQITLCVFFCEHKAPWLKKKSGARLLPVTSQPCHSSELNLYIPPTAGSLSKAALGTFYEMGRSV